MTQKSSSLTEEQIKQQKNMNLMLPILSAYISYIMPVALGIYWLLGSVLQIITQVIIDKLISRNKKIMLKEGEEK
jgi:YidC/Oxa1 family membrane protein insertase